MVKEKSVDTSKVHRDRLHAAHRNAAIAWALDPANTWPDDRKPPENQPQAERASGKRRTGGK